MFDRGVAAWRTGHRPGTTPEQWGYARINSFATGGKTRTTADADLWKKHKGMKESEFEPHWMYDPETGEKKWAKKPEDHEKMSDMGWVHEKPVNEALDPKADASTWIDDFIKSDAPQFEGKTKDERIKMALAAYYSARKEAGLE